jgi:hypothetical protein
MEYEGNERRRRTLSDEDLLALTEILEKARSVPAEVHRVHHEFVSALIERERRKTNRLEKTKTHVIGWGIVSGLTGIGYLIWDWLRSLKGGG